MKLFKREKKLPINPRFDKRRIKSGMVSKPTVGSVTFDVVNIFLGVLAAFVCIIPIWHVFMASISDPFSLISHEGLVLWPVGNATFEGYEYLFQTDGLLIGYGNTLIYVLAIVGIGLITNVVGGYCLSRDTKLKGLMMMFLVFPMMFTAGMIPTFMIVRGLGLYNTRLAVIMLESINVMNIILGVNAFKSVPESTVEASYLDGAGHLRTMFQIMLPQCMSLFIVTILSSFVASWNSWLNAKVYTPFDRSLWPLQMWIQQIVADNADVLQSANPNYVRYLAQYCTVIAATLPILCLFPFFQKRMEKGVVVGAVKG